MRKRIAANTVAVCSIFLFSNIASAGAPPGQSEEKAALPNPALSPVRSEKSFPGAVVERRPLMGTIFTAMVVPPKGMDDKMTGKVLTEAFHEAEKLQAAASAFDAESELSRFNRSEPGKEVVLSPMLFALLERSILMAELSQGAFDPTLGGASRLWRRARSRGVLPGDAVLKQTLEGCGYGKIKLNPASGGAVRGHPGLLVDLGGIGKGAALDLMANVLKKSGITCFRLSTTSDVLVGDPPPGEKSWKIRLSPSGDAVELVRQAVSTSGTEHQFAVIAGRKYAHLIDPSTGLGMTREAGVSVIADAAATADAGATALVFLKTEQRQSFCSAAGIRKFFIVERKENAQNGR